jgi:hypothetical protein
MLEVASRTLPWRPGVAARRGRAARPSGAPVRGRGFCARRPEPSDPGDREAQRAGRRCGCGTGVTCGELIASVSEPMAAAVATKLVLTDLVRTLALDRECRARVLRE